MPLMSGSARGKVGALIFNTWRSFNVVKAFRSPSQPRTAAQVNARARLTQFSQSWAALTGAQIAAWAQYAIDHLLTDWTGQAKRLTAQNWYIGCNTRSKLVGGAEITDPPASAAPDSGTGVTVTDSGAGAFPISLAWTTPVAADQHFIVYKQGPISKGRSPTFAHASILEIVAASSGTPEELIAAPAAGRYGFWVQIIDETTGLASALEAFVVDI
jgi:hypothetical protein